MTAEYGIFNDEGCLERQCFSLQEAEERAATYDPEDEVSVAEMCPDHFNDEQPKDGCEICEQQEADEQEDEEGS